MKNVLVTGGLGFIGSHLVDRLLMEKGVEKVSVLDNRHSSVVHVGHWGVRVSYYDLDVRYQLVPAFFEKFDTVFHLAAISRTVPAIENPLLCHVTNATGTLHVLEASRHAGVKRVVLTSSNVALAGPTVYRSSKKYLEDLQQVYSELYGQSVVALRLSNAYGTRLTPPACFASLQQQKASLGFITITGNGTQTRDFSHVSDVVEAFILAGHSNYKGTTDICTGIDTSLDEVAKYFNCPVVYIAPRPGDVDDIFQSPIHAEKILGYKAKVKLADGIKDCL